MTGYKIDNCTRPITVTRPGEKEPSFWVDSIEEAFNIIDVDRQPSKCIICTREHGSTPCGSKPCESE